MTSFLLPRCQCWACQQGGCSLPTWLVARSAQPLLPSHASRRPEMYSARPWLPKPHPMENIQLIDTISAVTGKVLSTKIYYTLCGTDLDYQSVKRLDLLLSHFWQLLKQVTYFEEAEVVVTMGLSLKPQAHCLNYCFFL